MTRSRSLWTATAAREACKKIFWGELEENLQHRGWGVLETPSKHERATGGYAFLLGALRRPNHFRPGRRCPSARGRTAERCELVSSNFHHLPVLLEETTTQLALRPGAVIVDGTLGGGGHAGLILERTGPDGVLLGIDRDPEALEAAKMRLAKFGPRFRAVRSSFAHLDEAVREAGFERVDGVLLDLGVSSHQLDAPHRGFRFATDIDPDQTPLDMRMDPSQGETAADLLARASAETIEGWLREYGELPGAHRLARAITERRREEPLRTTADLLQLIETARVGRGRRHNPATLVFQALRIAVNDELGALESGLDAAIQVLRPGGRLAVIAYHSLEDRMVKRCFRAEARGCICPPQQPVCTCGRLPRLKTLTRKPIRPEESDIRNNPRARSGRLRSAERIEEAA